MFVYGPPAVGKLTVSRELSKLTGFKLFHNHVSVDFVKSVFEFGTPTFWRLVDAYRRDLIEEAAKADVSAIFTFVYARGSDDSFVEDIERRVRGHGGEFCPVRLYCSRVEIMRRVRNQKRRELGKLSTRNGLTQLFKKHDLNSGVPGAVSLNIDTTIMSPKSAARAIVRHFHIDANRRQSRK